MRRREVIAGLTLSLAARAARAQQHPPMGVPESLAGKSVIAFLHIVSVAEYGFRRGLSESGFVEGGNLVIDYRWMTERPERLPVAAADLASRDIKAIICIDSDLATRTAKAATRTTPIVFTTSGDPVGLGFVDTLKQPGGNATGVTTFGQELLPKRLELLREFFPKADRIALLTNASNAVASRLEIESAKAAAGRLGVEMIVVSAADQDEIESAMADAARQSAAAVLVTADAFLSTRHEYIAVQAARHGLPTVSHDRLGVLVGQLLSYSPNSDDLYRLAGLYAGRILKGEKPADLPVVQPTKFETVVNLKTAMALGLTIPPSLLARADEVIE